MTQPALFVTKGSLLSCLTWFEEDFSQSIISLRTGEFPEYPLPRDVQSVQACWKQVRRLVDEKSEPIDVTVFFEDMLATASRQAHLFKQMILRYRRQRAAQTEIYREKTFHAELIQTLDEEINSLDVVVQTDWFQRIEPLRLPRASDFLPVQYLEQSPISRIVLAAR